MGLGSTATTKASVHADIASRKYPDTMTITNNGPSSTDSYGNTTTTPSTVASNVPCVVREMTAKEEAQAGGLEGLRAQVIETVTTHAIEAQYTLTVNARSPFGARAFQVVGSLPTSGPRLKVLVTEG